MTRNREVLLSETAMLFGRSTRVLDPIRLRVWDEMGIAQPQLRILFRVRAQPGIDLRTLAAELNISPSAASQQVDKLVERGLLDRTPDPADRRRLRLELTEIGTAATRAISKSAHAYVESLLETLDDQDLKHLNRLLTKILEEAQSRPVPTAVRPEDIEIEESLRARVRQDQ